jgi:hypothetical protein
MKRQEPQNIDSVHFFLGKKKACLNLEALVHFCSKAGFSDGKFMGTVMK